MTEINTTPTATAPDRCYLIATDGACRGNPGPGGWGAHLVSYEGSTVRATRDKSGWKRHTTNNEMELTAAIRALAWLPNPNIPATIISDSQYLIKGMSEWIDDWIGRGWRKADGKAVQNRNLWEELIAAVGERQVTWRWVPGHSGHPENERADHLAKLAIDRMPRC